MKKSHRKDVIIARIIFAVLCLLLIALIVWMIMLIRGKLVGSGTDTGSSQTETVQQLPPVTENPDLPPVTESIEGLGDTQYDTAEESDGSEEAEETDGTNASDVSDDAEGSETYIWTSNGVNMRTEPSVNGSVVTVLDAGTQLTLLGEENGWVLVSYNGQQGYVCVDYITDTNPSGTGVQ